MEATQMQELLLQLAEQQMFGANKLERQAKRRNDVSYCTYVPTGPTMIFAPTAPRSLDLRG